LGISEIDALRKKTSQSANWRVTKVREMRRVRPEGFEPSTLGSEGNQKRKKKSLFSQGIYRFLAILPMSES
jgi:hypothetical protein